MASPARFTVVGLGEALFDIIGPDACLGGAPLNVAVHAHQLAAPHGGRGVPVSRVGQDDLGEQALTLLRDRGLDTARIETDPDRPTGQVFVDLDAQGQPTYDILPNVAWDNLQFDPDLEDLAQQTTAVAFGSLAQRDAQSRNTIYRFLDVAARSFKLFDVNLRQDYYDQRVLRRSAEYASAIKLNDQELPVVARLLGVAGGDEEKQAGQMLRQYALAMVVLTRGAKGTRIFAADNVVDGAAAPFEPASGADSVGAGDACTAAILVGRCLRLPLQQLADAANRAGAFVAGQPGATPVLPPGILDAQR